MISITKEILRAEGEDQLMRGLVEHVLIVYVGVRNLMSVGVRNIFTNRQSEFPEKIRDALQSSKRIRDK